MHSERLIISFSEHEHVLSTIYRYWPKNQINPFLPITDYSRNYEEVKVANTNSDIARVAVWSVSCILFDG